jgi:hypothetical protein
MEIDCKLIRFEVIHNRHRDRYQGTYVKAWLDDFKVGEGGTRAISGTHGKTDLAVVGTIRVEPGVRRCGVGTRIYERLLQASCNRGLRLASDASRTKYSEKFWKKQNRKGRASCVRVDGRGAKLDDYFRTVGSWPCHHYEMKEACPRTGLDRSCDPL